VAGLPIAERAKIAIGETGPMTTEQIAEVLDSPRSTVASSLSRDHRFASENGRWEPSEMDW
jgi:DNA-directed RNA polymerase specialized sigma24 family protein